MSEEPIIRGTEAVNESVASADARAKVEGATTINDSLSFEVDLLAQESAQKVAKQIAESIVGKIKPQSNTRDESKSGSSDDKPRVILLDQKLTAALALYRTFVTQCDLLTNAFSQTKVIAEQGIDYLRVEVKGKSTGSGKEGAPEIQRHGYESVREQVIAQAASEEGKTNGSSSRKFIDEFLSTATTHLDAAANLLGFFSVDTEYHGRPTTVSETAFIFPLGELLKKRGVTFEWPSISFPIKSHGNIAQEAKYIRRLNRASEAANSANQKIQTLAAIVNDLGESHTKLKTAKQRLANAHQHYDAARVVFDDLREQFFQTDRRFDLSPSELLFLAETVLQEFGGHSSVVKLRINDSEDQDKNSEGDNKKSSDDIHFLYVVIEKAGGDYRIRRHLWQALTGEPSLSFAGGTIVSYVLLNARGEFVVSNTEADKSKYRSHPAAWKAEEDANKFTMPIGSVLLALVIWGLGGLGAYFLICKISNPYLLVLASALLGAGLVTVFSKLYRH